MVRGQPKADQFNGPKKPVSGAYFMWCGLNRQGVMDVVRKQCVAEGRSFDLTKVGKTLAERYKVECTEEQKKGFAALTVVAMKEYSAKLAAWKETEQYAAFQKAKKDYEKKGSAKKDKQELKNAGQPNKPKTAYLFFVNENRPEVTASLKKEHGDAFKIGMVATRSAELWKKVSDEGKIPYGKKAAAEKEEYLQKMAAFKETDQFKAIDAKNQANKKKRAPRARKQKVVQAEVASGGDDEDEDME